MATKILALLVVLGGVAQAQAPQKITIGIYAPTVEFGTAQARLAYVQGLAKAIEQNTNIKTEAESYASIAALKKADPDFAIIDATCVAASNYKVLANANIGGSTVRPWALFSSTGGDMQSLRGKKVVYVETSCNDNGFVNNAMLESEVDSSFFSSHGEKDLTAAIASVASYKTAQAVFAPVGSAKGLTKVFDTGAVPNPAFVEVGNKAAAVSSQVAAAVIGYGGGGAIAGWAKGAREPYGALAARMQPVRKSGLFASPEPVRIDAKDVLQDPTTLKDPAFVAVRHHFVRPPGARMGEQ